MRFLNTATLQLEDVPDSELGPKYPQTASLGYKYAWDCACCVNKADMNEVCEAINITYHLFQGGDLCMIYLEDVGPGRKSVLESTWFSRGWTLQELIAPRKAAFYDHRWSFLGMKSDLLEDLSSKTGIPNGVLSHAVSLDSYSIAQRMSWAARRTTARAEDRAYSLLGIFGINLPQIYGEREKAFQRLQQAIVRQYKDESIFAWAMGKDDNTAGMYASSPESFAQCGDVISTYGSMGFSENNGEISMRLKTYPHSMETYYALLNCSRKSCPDSRIAIVISRTSEKKDDEYIRLNGVYQGGTPLLAPSNREGFTTRVVRVSVDPSKRPLNQTYGFWLRSVLPPGHDAFCIELKDWGSAGIISLELKPRNDGRSPTKNRNQKSRLRWLKLGFDEDFNPMVLLAKGHGLAKPTPTRFMCDVELFNQAIAQGPTSQAHKDIFDNHWIRCQERIPGKWYRGPEGISVLKVDKREGMTCTVRDLKLRVDIKLVPDVGPGSTQPRRSDEDPRQIWAMDIADAGNRNSEENSTDQREEHATRRTVFTAGCCGLQWTIARRKKHPGSYLVDPAHQS